MNRPFKVKHFKFVGVTASLLSGLMVVLYLIPGSGSSLTREEWIITGGWALLGLAFYCVCRKHYSSRFGSMDPD